VYTKFSARHDNNMCVQWLQTCINDGLILYYYARTRPKELTDLRKSRRTTLTNGVEFVCGRHIILM